MNEFWNRAMEFICDFLRRTLIKQGYDVFGILNSSARASTELLARTPKEWNGTVFETIQSLSENVILPIGGTILTFVVCYEIISLVLERNNMHDFDSSALYVIVFKMVVGAFVLSHSFEICMAVFDVAQYVIDRAGNLLQTNGELTDISQFEETIEVIKNPIELVGIMITMEILKFVIWIIALGIMLVMSGRFIEIYCWCSVAPLPFATFLNKEWGQIGFNYIRGIIALAFQVFLMMICFAIYYGLVSSINVGTDIAESLFQSLSYSVLLFFALFKTSQWSKSIFNTH